MADDQPVDLPESSAPPGSEAVDTPPAVPCRHLRNKGMFVYNGGAFGVPHDDYDNTIYWCVKTMKGFGPDDEMVSRDDCTSAERSCYEPF
jgi:hypothetical protein